MRIFLLFAVVFFIACAPVKEDAPKQLKGDPFELKAQGIQYLVENNPERAIPYLYTASLHWPDDAELLGALGEAMLRTGRNEQGIGFLKRATEVSPYDLNSRLALGNAYKILGYYDDAVKQYSSIIDTRPDNLMALGSLGDTYYKSGNNAECVKHFAHFMEVVEKKAARLSERDKRFYELAKKQHAECKAAMK